MNTLITLRNRFFSLGPENGHFNSISQEETQTQTPRVNLLQSNYSKQFYGLNAVGGVLSIIDRSVRAYTQDWFSPVAQVLSMTQIFLGFGISYFALRESNLVKQALASRDSFSFSALESELLESVNARNRAAKISIYGDVMSVASQLLSLYLQYNDKQITPLSSDSPVLSKLTVALIGVGTLMSYSLLNEIAKNAYKYINSCHRISGAISETKNDVELRDNKFITEISQYIECNFSLKSYYFRMIAIMASYLSRTIFTVWLMFQLMAIFPGSESGDYAIKLNPIMVNIALMATLLEISYGASLVAIAYFYKITGETNLPVNNATFSSSIELNMQKILDMLKHEDDTDNLLTNYLLKIGVPIENINEYSTCNSDDELVQLSLARDLNLIDRI